MKKFIISAIVLVANVFAFSNVFAQTASTSSPAASTVPATASAVPSTANAAVDCKEGKKGVAKATGEGVYAVAGCGGKAKAVVKNHATKAVHAKKVENKDNAEVVWKLAHENADLKVKNSSKHVFFGGMAMASVTRFPIEGKVYSDAEGNTFERHQGGSRECKFYVNGELVKRMFVQHPDPRESKKQCDLLSQGFYSTMSSTTPEKEVVYNKHQEEHRGPIFSAPVGEVHHSAPPTVSSNGNHTCELKFDGQVVETTKTMDDNSCKAWTQAKAREKGWTAR